MNDYIKGAAVKYSEYITQLCDVECNILDVENRCFVEQEDPKICREECAFYNTDRCNCVNTHLYGCFESERWSGKYIYYCPLGVIFISTALYDNNNHTNGGLVTGPIVMGEFTDAFTPADANNWEFVKNIPNFSTIKVNSLSEMIGAVCGFISNKDGGNLNAAEQQSNMLNLFYEMVDTAAITENHRYLIEGERQMQVLISSGDKPGSQKLLNKLLGHIFFSSSGNLEVIKARVLELVVLLSRAAIEGGADVNQIFWLNTNYIKEVEVFKNIDDLSRWLAVIMHRYISSVFDFTDIKHVDVMYKVFEYIKTHYKEKISLDDVAAHVFLSKSYLSTLFKEESGTNFTNYVNNLRVERSKPFLLDNKLSLTEIANMMGFEDQSYFTKVFKKIVGVSPGKFRELRGKMIVH